MEFDDLRGWMKGEDCVVVGCGPSAVRAPRHWSIACNRAVKLGDFDFVLCAEPKGDEMWRILADAAPLFVFTHLVPRPHKKNPHPRMVTFTTDISDMLSVAGGHDLLSVGSPYFAAAVAGALGFETIGLIGVDLTGPRYPDIEPHDKAWAWLRDALAKVGSSLVNLSPQSRLGAVTKASWSAVRTKQESAAVAV